MSICCSGCEYMDNPPPYTLPISNSTDGISLSQAGMLLAISSSVGTELCIIPSGIQAAEVYYMQYSPVSIDISTTANTPLVPAYSQVCKIIFII